jgi:hypothetical protein
MNLLLQRRIEAGSVDYRTNPLAGIVFSGMVESGELAIHGELNVLHVGHHEGSTG